MEKNKILFNFEPYLWFGWSFKRVSNVLSFSDKKSKPEILIPKPLTYRSGISQYTNSLDNADLVYVRKFH